MEITKSNRTQLIGTAILVVPAIIMAVYAYARRVPYLLNIHNMWTYFVVAIAIVSMLSVYLLFFHTSKDLKINRTTLCMSKKNKIKAVVGAVGCSAMLAWPSWGLVGLSAYLFSREPFFELFTIDSLEPGGRKGWDVKLVGIKSKNKYSLTVSNLYMNTSFPWKEGEVVCAKGRTSFLGAIVENFNTGNCELDRFTK